METPFEKLVGDLKVTVFYSLIILAKVIAVARSLTKQRGTYHENDNVPKMFVLPYNVVVVHHNGTDLRLYRQVVVERQRWSFCFIRELDQKRRR